jgi:hemoglobin
MGSLYERLGGEAAVQAAVVRFYEKVMADASLAPFFDGVDMRAQVRKQIAFMTMAFGGPHRYTGRALRDAHAGLVARGLGDAHFDGVVRHLESTLGELGVAPSLTAEVLTLVEAQRADVLSR